MNLQNIVVPAANTLPFYPFFLYYNENTYFVQFWSLYICRSRTGWISPQFKLIKLFIFHLSSCPRYIYSCDISGQLYAKYYLLKRGVPTFLSNDLKTKRQLNLNMVTVYKMCHCSYQRWLYSGVRIELSGRWDVLVWTEIHWLKWQILLFRFLHFGKYNYRLVLRTHFHFSLHALMCGSGNTQKWSWHSKQLFI